MLETLPDFVEIYDTTLRDGTQREGLSLSLADKLRIAERLDAFGVAFIEGGWPGSNPKDEGFFEQARDRDWKHAKIAAFGSTRRAGIHAEDDPQLKKLIESGAPVCTIFGKTSAFHVTEIIRTTLEMNLEMIRESVAFLVSEGRRTIYDAEHFFDGYKLNADYALETLRAAHEAGAETLVLCDTNGGTLPWEIEEIVQKVRSFLPHARIGLHPHDDNGCGVANALAAVRAGAVHVQGTINGYGERCGNANLCSIIPGLELKLGVRSLPEGKLAEISDLSHFVAEIANLPANDHAPYVGRSAFAHKGGVHVSAIRRFEESYQHIDPRLVGNECRVVVSELSGRSNVQSKAEEMGLSVSASEGAKIVEIVKARESEGYAYEAAEASFALLMKRAAPDYEPLFEVLDYQATVGKRGDDPSFIEATIRVRVDDHEEHTAGSGNGPVSALDEALLKALRTSFPEIDQIHLVDYKVRILDGQNGTRSTTRVLIDMQAGERVFSVVGASSNIIEASLLALIDGVEYGLREIQSDR